MSLYKTPLRYPGGKQRIWRFIDEIVTTNDLEGGHYVEPYAGGAGVAMELLLRGKVSGVHLNDACVAVFSFWDSVLNETEKMCRKISRASLTVEEWKRQREIFRKREEADPLELGFATFYLNRCNRSGILTGGVIGGIDQSGPWKIDARFPRNELIKRIEAIADRKRAIHIRNWDAERFLMEYVPKLQKKTLVYCDPPYFKKADRLYPNHYSREDHARIAKVIQDNLKIPWVVSYDSAPEILSYYPRRRSFLYTLQYNAARAYKGREMFIFSDKITIPERSALPSIDETLLTSLA
ncbi:MAG: DNA adenine methylase [Candidatus Manganitrophus sp. SB1]|nr:DNA adenine methylase [Candidatus Manganitrophus morganii]